MVRRVRPAGLVLVVDVGLQGGDAWGIGEEGEEFLRKGLRARSDEKKPEKQERKKKLSSPVTGSVSGLSSPSFKLYTSP